MSVVTLWYRWTVDKNHPQGHWEFNHLQDGPPIGGTPTPKQPIHDLSWAAAKWSYVRARLVEGSFHGMRVPRVEKSPDSFLINPHFTFGYSANAADPSETILDLKYKGVLIARFRDADYMKCADRALRYIKTHGYLAEWTARKNSTGVVEDWTDDLFVHV